MNAVPLPGTPRHVLEGIKNAFVTAFKARWPSVEVPTVSNEGKLLKRITRYGPKDREVAINTLVNDWDEITSYDRRGRFHDKDFRDGAVEDRYSDLRDLDKFMDVLVTFAGSSIAAGGLYCFIRDDEIGGDRESAYRRVLRPVTPPRTITKPEVYAVYDFFKTEIRERWPDAIFPKLFPADRRWLRDVLDFAWGGLDEVAEAIRVLVWDWEEACRQHRKGFLPIGGLYPNVKHLGLWAGELTRSIGRGISDPGCTLGSYYDRYVSCLNLRPPFTGAELFAARKSALPLTESTDEAAARVAASEARWPSLDVMQLFYDEYKLDYLRAWPDYPFGRLFDLDDREHVFALLYRHGAVAFEMSKIAVRDFDRIRAKREGRFWTADCDGRPYLRTLRHIAPTLARYAGRGTSGANDDDLSPELRRALNDRTRSGEFQIELLRCERPRQRAEA